MPAREPAPYGFVRRATAASAVRAAHRHARTEGVALSPRRAAAAARAPRVTRQRIIIVGAFPEVIELAEACGRHIVGLVDPNGSAARLGYPILGADRDAARIHARYPAAAAFVAIDDPERRARLVDLYTHAGFAFASLIHPQAKLSRSVTLGVGVMVQYGAHLSSDVRVADHVRINVYANLMHDVSVGRCTTVAPNAVVLGRVRIGERCYIGAHSTVLPDIEIAARSCIGAQATVTKSVVSRSVMVGNPARAQ